MCIRDRKLDQLIKNQLFFAHRRSKQSGRAQQQPTSNDPMSAWLGTVVPSSIPESAAWWQVPKTHFQAKPARQQTWPHWAHRRWKIKGHQKNLAAISDDGELGLMQLMENGWKPTPPHTHCLVNGVMR